LKRELVGPSGPEPGWEYIKENDNGFTWTLHWKDEGDCKFSCEDIFMEIAKNETCELVPQYSLASIR
jgi:hypothetical protein